MKKFFFCVECQNAELHHPIEKLEFIVTNRSEIWRIKKSDQRYLYKTNATSIADVDYHLGKNLLIWIDAEKREIHSQSLYANVDDESSSSSTVIFKQNDWEPLSLAVDFISDKIYVVDFAGVKIDLFDLNGLHHSILIGTDLSRPLDIEFDPYDRFLFILDGFRIIRANADGSQPVVILRENINAVSGLSLDIIGKTIYWTRGNYSVITGTSYHGEEVVSYALEATQPIWSKFIVENGTVHRTQEFVDYKSNCEDAKIFTLSTVRSSIKIKSVHKINPVPTIRLIRDYVNDSSFLDLDPCKKNNGDCQHTCIFVSKDKKNNKDCRRRCVCDVGTRLDFNLKNCTNVQDFLIYTQPGIIKSHLTSDNVASNEPYLPITVNKSKIHDFTYHFVDDYLYYLVTSVLKNDIVYRIHPKLHDPVVFLTGKNENYQSIAVDWSTDNLYFTNAIAGTIKVTKTNYVNPMTMLLLNNLEQPEDIAVHPYKGLIFFFQTNATTGITLLTRAHCDGKNLTIFRTVTLKKRCGFTIDHDDERIYLHEWRTDRVIHVDLDFGDLRVLKTSFTRFVYTLAISEKWMYVVTTNSEGIYRVDKKTGEEAEFVLSDVSNRIIKVKAFDPVVQKSMSQDHHPCFRVDRTDSCPEFCFAVPNSTNGSLIKVCAKSNDD